MTPHEAFRAVEERAVELNLGMASDDLAAREIGFLLVEVAGANYPLLAAMVHAYREFEVPRLPPLVIIKALVGATLRAEPNRVVTRPGGLM